MTLPPSDDEALLAEFRAAMTGAGPGSADFAAAARAARSRSMDVDQLLAELTVDPSQHDELAARTGPGSTGGALVFDGDHYRVRAEILGTDIVGQVTPPDAGRVSCETGTGTHDETLLDERGRFSLKVPPRGPVRLHMETDGRTAATPWLQLP
jgi:hypothetical protein